MRLLLPVLLAALLTAGANAQSLVIAAFNVESGDDTTAERAAEDVARMPPLHLWALQEVEDAAMLATIVETLNAETGLTYVGRMGTTGGRYGDDFLAFIYLQDAFANVSFEELEAVGGSRLPLVMRATSWTGHNLTFVNNHFNRGNETRRRQQAINLRDWIAQRPQEAIIAMGTFNFDYDFRGARQGGNRAFEQFADGGHISWPEPMCLANDNCPSTGSQCNPNYESLLDFIFLAGTAFDWPAVTDLGFLDEPYCGRDQRGYPDHRPVMGQILLGGRPAGE
jgi:endonuclease/exonuclease/phosphatase family metal-dependent hydrolase